MTVGEAPAPATPVLGRQAPPPAPAGWVSSSGWLTSSKLPAVLRFVGRAAFGVVLVWVGLIVLNPDGSQATGMVADTSRWLAAHDVPSRLADQETVEVVANAVLFFPLGLLGMLVWWRRGVLWWTGAGFVASLVVELAQWQLLPERTATTADVVVNTGGTFVGAVVGGLLVGLAWALWRLYCWLAGRR